MKTKIKEKFKNIYTEFKKDKVLQIALVFAVISAILGCVDLKVNAAENNSIDIVRYEKDSAGIESKSVFSTINLNYTDDYELYWYSTYNTYTNGSHNYELIAVSKEHSGLGENMDYAFTMNGETRYVTILTNGSSHYSNGSGMYLDVENSPVIVTRLDKIYYHADFVSDYLSGVIQPDIDYNSFDIDDDMPIVQNVDFDRLETSEFVNGENTKKIIDYIRFQPNSDYKLMIMLCPTVYSTYGSKDYVADFKKYEYSSWIYMCVADENLKEISCDLGTFVLPTDDSSDIKASDYYSYYDEILNTLPQNPFKPTMAYRLAYVDVDNGLIGPSTYIKPLAYNNLLPDEETYSYFTLYSDGSRNTEKIMNLKTWSSVYDVSSGESPKDLDEVIQDMKDTVVNVGDYLKDKVVVDNDVDVQEATNWLYSVINFIKGTPQVVGSVLGFLPQPILYGMYVCIFLGVIASGLAIVKALL